MSEEIQEDRPLAGEAAKIIADFFATTVIAKLHQGYKDLYVWEREALEWLRAYRDSGGDVPLNAWTMSYLHFGPPPWPNKSPLTPRAKQAGLPNNRPT